MQSHLFSQTVTRTVALRYLRHGAPELPTLIYLHGAGAKGDDLSLVERESLPRLVQSGFEIPFQLICPQCPAGLPGWPIADLIVFLEGLQSQNVIGAKIAVTGISMGGRGAWELAYWWSEYMAAIVPLCGPSLPTLAPRLKDVPIWAFHGENDDIVPVERTAEMIEALQRTGNSARFTRLENAGHNIGEAVYERAELWEWLNRKIQHPHT